MAAAKTPADPEHIPSIKQLASSDPSIRAHAVTTFRTYLRGSTRLSDVQLLQVWKGLHYCMFMCDKPRNQQRLARDLAAMADVLPPDRVLPWLAAFWKTMAREWGGVDSLRVDKYLYLIRCYVNKGFELCRRTGWDGGFLARLCEGVLAEEGGPLSPRDHRVPDGLRLHVLDVWVDELQKVDEQREAPVDVVLAPVRRLKAESLSKSVRARAKDSVEDDRLVGGNAWRPEAREEEEAHDEKDDGGDFNGFED